MKLGLFLLLLFSFSVNKLNNEDRLKQIRSWYKSTESMLSSCIQITESDIEDPDYVIGGSSDLTAYLDTSKNEIIKLIEHTYYDWSENIVSYYFLNDSCFFIFEQSNGAEDMYTAEDLGISEEELWQRGGEAKTIGYLESRFYFDSEGYCFRNLYKQKVVQAEETKPDLSDVKNVEVEIDTTFTFELVNHGSFLRKELQKKYETRK